MTIHTFSCIDGHTCGNPVRMVVEGAPALEGATMSARRRYFMDNYDWIRTGLMFEPRGHDLMSGAILMPPLREDCDLGVIFIETTGCLPMCGHGAMGIVTMALEQRLATPREEGVLRLDTPAGRVDAHYRRDGDHVAAVRLHNVASYVAATGVAIDCPGLGSIRGDIAYGGNFYAIIEAQKNYSDLSDLSVDDVLRYSPELRRRFNDAVTVVHPGDATIAGVSHIMWTGHPTKPEASARNAVFYGARAIDRSPCGTGTSARMAQLSARGDLAIGDDFVHESIIGSLFSGRIEGAATVGKHTAIRPSVEGWAVMTGTNAITIDDARDPYAHGFQVV